MQEVGLKLGQLLAVADAVHAGYCADLRGGAVPARLIGNATLATAQFNPAKALASLCRRWAPYANWAKRPNVIANGELGFNIPSLVSVDAGAPYFHSGAAPTLDEVLQNVVHRTAGTAAVDTLADPAVRANLVLFLRSIDEKKTIFP